MVLIILVLPLLITITLGSAIAHFLGLTGIVWWLFCIVFYLGMVILFEFRHKSI